MDPSQFIADYRIADGIADGQFDNLPGAGKPIDDLDVHLGDGWWAARKMQDFSARERRDAVARDRRRVDGAVRMAPDHIEARRLLAEHNESIAACNFLSKRSTFLPLKPIDVEATMRQWHLDRIARRRA